MRLPETAKRPILYITTAVLLTGTTLYVYKQGQVPPPTSAMAEAIARPEGAATASVAQVRTLEAKQKPAPNASGKGVAAAPATTTADAPRPKVQTYKVQSGDTIGTIAERFGLKTATVLWANGLDEQDLINPGDELKIPAEDGLLYAVLPGDNLWDIAGDHGADIDAVIKANPDVEPGALKIGQLLIIPGGQPVIRRGMVASRSGSSRAAASGSLEAWPVSGPLTDPFGYRIHPVYGTQNFHDGMDIGVPSGTPLGAAAGGKVIMAGWYGGYGITVKIDHGGGLVTLYAHMSQTSVVVGQNVGAGELIGYSGNTGVSTGPHLHFTVLVGGQPVDPADWLP